MFVLLACAPDPIALRTPPGPKQDPVEDPVEDIPGDTDPWCVADVRINELVAANHQGITDEDGDTSDWFELDGDVDLTGWTLNGWVIPALILEGGVPRRFFASGKDRVGDQPHTDFALDAEGDTLELAKPDGCVVDRIETPRLYADVAYGRDTDGEWSYFLEPTPGAPNTTESRPGFADVPVFSAAGGIIAAPLAVTAGDARCTTDGSVPTEDSGGCSLTVDPSAGPVVVRARAWEDGLWPSRIATATWFDADVFEDTLVMSLVVDPPDLWDEESGIYVPGPNAEPNYPYFGANFWQVWEKDLHVEVYDGAGLQMFTQDAGIQIAGGYSRAFDQRNFELIARTGYGPDTFTGPVFPDEDIQEFSKLYLRNGGDWCGTQLVDGVVQSLFRDTAGRRYDAVDAQAYAPALVYLNGEFWGVYELKERLDESWIASHRGEDPEALDRVKLGWTHNANWTLDQGDWEAFAELEALVDGGLTDDEYSTFEQTVDVDNFISATVAQGWIGNTDWWGNNIRMWRPRRDGGRWRWMVYDFGHGWPSWTYDHLATSVSGDWRGLPLASALAHEQFRARFINVHADYLNTTLAPTVAAGRVRALAADIRGVIDRQQERWCGGAAVDSWEAGIDYAVEFAMRRPATIDAGLIAHLGLAGHAQLSIEVEPAGAATFHLAVVDVEAPFSGTYYQDVPVEVTVVPAEGYTFVGWSDGETAVTRTLPMGGDTVVRAVLE